MVITDVKYMQTSLTGRSIFLVVQVYKHKQLPNISHNAWLEFKALHVKDCKEGIG
jgi:hypothetical protein